MNAVHHAPGDLGYNREITEATSTYRVLLVCTGNTCRSPMAEAIARQMVSQRPGIRFESAGVFAADGAPASAEAVQAMADQGLDLSGHRSRALTVEMVDQADEIFTMTGSHRAALIEAFPGAADKTRRLDAVDIDDPIGGPLAAYQATADQIERALRKRFTEES